MNPLKYLASFVFLLILGHIMFIVVYLMYLLNLPSLVIEHISEFEKGKDK